MGFRPSGPDFTGLDYPLFTLAVLDRFVVAQWPCSASWPCSSCSWSGWSARSPPICKAASAPTAWAPWASSNPGGRHQAHHQGGRPSRASGTRLPYFIAPILAFVATFMGMVVVPFDKGVVVAGPEHRHPLHHRHHQLHGYRASSRRVGVPTTNSPSWGVPLGRADRQLRGAAGPLRGAQSS